MRILWIEDEKYVVQDKSSLFGIFAQHQDIVSIDNFSRAYQTVANELRQYDLLVMDIDLRYSAENQTIIDFANQFGLSAQDFLKEAGFHLYLKALAQGFPQERVVFLTGNVNPDIRSLIIQEFKAAMVSSDDDEWEQAIENLKQLMSETQREAFVQALETQDEDIILAWLKNWIGGEPKDSTYEKFLERFKQARIIPPEAFDKKEQDCSTHLQNWLRSHCERNPDNQEDYDYLTLRRGILNVVAEIQKDSGIHLTQDFQAWDKNTFLTGLIWQLRDFALPLTEYSSVYFALCDYLTKPFETFSGKDLLLDSARHFKLPLYSMRNWIAHGLLMGSDTQLSALDAGVTFLITMKSLFGVVKYGAHEELKRLFPDKSVSKQQIIHQIRALLNRDKYYRSPRQPLETIRRKTEKAYNIHWQRENYLRHFYATYLFSIQHPDSYELKDTPFNDIVFHQLQKYL